MSEVWAHSGLFRDPLSWCLQNANSVVQGSNVPAQQLSTQLHLWLGAARDPRDVDRKTWGPGALLALWGSVPAWVPARGKGSPAGLSPRFSEPGTVSPAVSARSPAACASFFTGWPGLRRARASAPRGHAC